MSSLQFQLPSLLVLLTYCVLAASSFGRSEFEVDGWEDIPEEEFAAEKPRIDPDANVEILYHSILVDDEGAERVSHYHKRLKIFTEAGVEQLSKVDIEYENWHKMKRVWARIIYPDRTVVRLNTDDFAKRDLFEMGRFKGYILSFSFPKLKPGCIVEYRYEKRRRFWIGDLSLLIREQWPTWQYDLRIRTSSRRSSWISIFNSHNEIERTGGEYVLSVANQPARETGDYLPPRKDYEPWVHLEYTDLRKGTSADKYWAYRGRVIEDKNDLWTRPRQRAVKKLAEDLFAGAKSSEEKLQRAYQYCVKEITNISYHTDRYSEQEIEDLKENSSPGDVVKRGYGTRFEINGLFASLATQAGFEAFLSQVEDKFDLTFKHDRFGSFSLPDWIVGVRENRSDEHYRFFDPGSLFVPYGRLNPENVDAHVIFADNKYFYWRKTDADSTKANVTRRFAQFELNEFGDLEGSVRLIYSGSSALRRRRLFVRKSDKEIEEFYDENEWKERCPSAEVRDVKVEFLRDQKENLVVTYQIKVSAYADLAGNRIILNPAVFEKGGSPFFVEPEREIGVDFTYPFRELNSITIQYPDTFELETKAFERPGFAGKVIKRISKLTEMPGTSSLKFTCLEEVNTSTLAVRVDDDGNTVVLLGLPYASVKAEFDEDHRQNAQELLLVRKR